ncbi:hypothetical protein MMC25_005033 [Agyrium rufum]|nr:hypothetical protein [Agyrium rufum]
MPGIVNLSTAQKRKHTNANDGTLKSAKKSRKEREEPKQRQEDSIEALEARISESRKHYNDIAKLLATASNHAYSDEQQAALFALCRVFSRLLAAGKLTRPKDASDNDTVIMQWLKARYNEFLEILLEQICSRDGGGSRSIALSLAMQIFKEEGTHLHPDGNVVWKTGLFSKIIPQLLRSECDEKTREAFAETYIKEYDDIRYYTYAIVSSLCDAEGVSLDNIISLLGAVEHAPDSEVQLEDFYLPAPERKTHDLYSLRSHKKQAQEAWLTILQQKLSKEQRKTVLGLLRHRIAPWFQKPELLMDFLTDAFDVSGSLSLMAMSGVFYLIQERNLDYPRFYEKLYFMLDANVLHSKHRSRFFRLLNSCLESTHLPSTVVASFIKRMSRLCLFAPPAAIVVVVPMLYNLFKDHPSTRFMIQRQSTDEVSDPFDMKGSDPMNTKAEESSIWEIETLQTHFHPNIATIARIISEQFTKQNYNLEDFLDHSYGSMLDGELSKDMKKPPIVEYVIPKHILVRNTAHDLTESRDALLTRLWNF